MSDTEDSITQVTQVPHDYVQEPESDAILSRDGTVKVMVRFWPTTLRSDKDKIGVGLVLPIWLFREIHEGEPYPFYTARDFRQMTPEEIQELFPDEP